MTRATLHQTLRRMYWLVAIVLGVSFFAKIADHVPGLAGSGFERLLKDAYEFLRDMSLLIATAGVAYITNVFQQRSSFVGALREEWREIVHTKSALFAFTQHERATREDYLEVFCKLSEAIDNMRTVYRNVGETEQLIGLYPFAPLHDMRRVLQTLDPAKRSHASAEDRARARDAILQSFYALRETFLEELDLEQPTRPVLIFGGKRWKKPGALASARRHQDIQRERQDSVTAADPTIDPLLTELYTREHATPKPWRAVDPAAHEPIAAPSRTELT